MKQKTVAEGIELVAVGEISLQRALARVSACQSCSESVSRPFATVLVEVLGAGASAEYVMCEPAKCPSCGNLLVESTLVRCEGEREEPNSSTVLKEFEMSWEETNVLLIDEAMLSQAQALVSGCGRCITDSEMTFDYILDELTSSDPAVTEYVLCHPAKCPRCAGEITEKTFVINY